MQCVKNAAARHMSESKIAVLSTNIHTLGLCDKIQVFFFHSVFLLEMLTGKKNVKRPFF